MRAGLVAATINVVIIAAFLWLEPAIPFARGDVNRPLALIVIAIALFVPALMSRVARSLQLSLNACLVTLVGLELVFLLAPSIFPDNVRVLVETGEPAARETIVERLPHSPFAKPRANVHVQIPGYYGPKGTFEYEWRSDWRGFKNLPEVAARGTYDLVAVGDSFTEGMGVAVEQTWTSLLSRSGHPTYNLGVQGYAPTQFLGAYEYFGRSLSARLVVVGLLGNVHERDRQFLGGAARPTDHWQVIGRLQDQDDVNRKRPLYLQTKEGYRVPIMIRQRHRFLTSAVVALAAHRIDFAFNFDLGDEIAESDKDVHFARGLSRYRREVSAARSELDPTALTASETWISTENAIARIAALARADGAKVLLLFFPNRGSAYYKRATGRDLAANASDLVQARTLREFAERNGMDMIDLTPAFQAAAAQLSDRATQDQYPFLPIDSHPSPRGHEIIAEQIARFLSSQP